MPPLRSSRNLLQQKRTLSPRKSQHLSVNVYNFGGEQVFSRSPRFKDLKADYNGDSYVFKPDSDF